MKLIEKLAQARDRRESSRTRMESSVISSLILIYEQVSRTFRLMRYNEAIVARPEKKNIFKSLINTHNIGIQILQIVHSTNTDLGRFRFQ